MGHLSLLLATAMLFPGDAHNTIDGYAPVSANPAYSDTTALPHRPHQHKIAYGDDPSQYGLLWLPQKNTESSGSLIVLIHGGCWLSAYDITHTFPLATALARHGYPVWNLEYRRSGETGGGWPTSYDDIQRGIRALPALGAFGVSPDQVILIGHSAGGHLALLAASDWEQLFPGKAPRVSAVGLAAITDIKLYAAGDNSCQQATPQFMGSMPEVNGNAYTEANPAERKITAPVTLLQGELDPIVPRAQFERLGGPEVNRVLEPGAGHFDWIHPGTPAFATLVQQLQAIGAPN